MDSPPLIFINSLPTSKIFGEKVDAWWYQKHGLDVQFWDISSLFWSQERLEGYYGGAHDYRYIGPGHKVFSLKEEVLQAIHSLGEKAIIWHLGWNLNGVPRSERWLLNAIVDAGLPFFVKQFEMDSFTGIVKKTKRWARHQVARLDFHGKQPTGFVGCGTVTREWVRQILPGTDFVSIPSPKVLWEKSQPLVEGPYVVFVDENIEYAPDARMLGFSVSSDVEGYYRRMNTIFQLVEDNTGYPVIIAASGKYRYPSDRFHGRTLLYGETFRLIQHAELAIGHSSVALDQAIIDRKPLLRIDDRSFQKRVRENMFYYTQFSGIEPIRSDRLESIGVAVSQVACDKLLAAKIEAEYFREPGVNGDYRDIIKQAFLSV